MYTRLQYLPSQGGHVLSAERCAGRVTCCKCGCTCRCSTLSSIMPLVSGSITSISSTGERLWLVAMGGVHSIQHLGLKLPTPATVFGQISHNLQVLNTSVSWLKTLGRYDCCATSVVVGRPRAPAEFLMWSGQAGTLPATHDNAPQRGLVKGLC